MVKGYIIPLTIYTQLCARHASTNCLCPEIPYIYIYPTVHVFPRESVTPIDHVHTYRYAMCCMFRLRMLELNMGKVCQIINWVYISVAQRMGYVFWRALVDTCKFFFFFFFFFFLNLYHTCCIMFTLLCTTWQLNKNYYHYHCYNLSLYCLSVLLCD